MVMVMVMGMGMGMGRRPRPPKVRGEGVVGRGTTEGDVKGDGDRDVAALSSGAFSSVSLQPVAMSSAVTARMVIFICVPHCRLCYTWAFLNPHPVLPDFRSS